MSVRLVLPRDAPAEMRRRSQPVRISTMREWVEYKASCFLLKNHQRLIGQKPGRFESPTELMRQHLLTERFDELQAIYTARVEKLIQTRERIDHLRRCIQSLCVLSAHKKSILAHFHMLEDVVSELDGREGQEQEALEGVGEIAFRTS